MLAMAAWIAVQLILPIRGALFASKIRWSGDGHRFSWRMRICDREAVGAFVVTDPMSGDGWRGDPDSFLAPHQTDKMIVRPDLILQFARHLDDICAQQGREVSVHAGICKSLNDRPARPSSTPGWI